MGFLRGWQRSVAVLPLLLIGLVADSGCYDTGDGSAPPLEHFYFPVGLKVSHGGTVLYAVNSNFDLQFNGGTIQSYDLHQIRHDTVKAIKDPTKNLPLIKDSDTTCADALKEGEPRRELGETCAPPVDSKHYFRDSAIIGAFATDLLLSRPPAELQGEFLVADGACTSPPCRQSTKVHADDPPVPAGNASFDRLFVPVRGNATLTWATVVRDSVESVPPADPKAPYAPFRLDCGQGPSKRCDAVHQIGEDPNEEGNSRHLTMPGEPFGATISEDGTSLVITHQNDTKTTLFSTGLSRTRNDGENDRPLPAIQFVADKLPVGGIDIAGVPHDPDAFLGARDLPRPAFLQTSRSIPEVSLIRRYSDEEGGVGPSTPRPFLDFEAVFPITVSAGGADSRGIVIDPTPRLACKARVAAVGPNQTAEERDRQMLACARKPARVFIANRSPAALLIGEVGGAQGIDGAYDPDRLTIHSSEPLSPGPSRVYLAPIVDSDGAYALRVFVVCFDSATIWVYDPDAGVMETNIRVAPGPFAMAFDPFSLEDVATHAQVPYNERDRALQLRRYRFAYVASFMQSFVQILDLEKALPNPATYGKVVYTLGRPTNPKGT
ncbi:MAG: hypothetical protein BGO98_15890 [Myxococcales bacterium 68-20]|nr:MAG: hypothetical protein BGO98_15890 [Myxococcales bacterium 68-20]